jgi:predicted transcriptional regulator
LRPPCEIVARDILPAIRSLVAKELIERYGFTQMTAARKLGITQAAISYYRDAKRGCRHLKQLEANPAIEESIDRIAEGIAKGILSQEEVVLKFCELCESLRKRN